MERYNMIVQAKVANELAKQFDWEKFTMDTITQGILNNAKAGFFFYTYYPANREINDKVIESVTEKLKKYGYGVVNTDPYSRNLVISWK